MVLSLGVRHLCHEADQVHCPIHLHGRIPK
jgi:hypothetical protein